MRIRNACLAILALALLAALACELGAAKQTATTTRTLGVAGKLVITTVEPLPPMVVGAPVNIQLEAVGGKPPYAWKSLVCKKELPDHTLTPCAGLLPPGLTLAPVGLLSGSPTEEGNFQVVFEVTDSAP